MKTLLKIIPLFLLSCNDLVDNEYVNPELQPFYDQFKYEAQRLNVNLPDKDILIDFGEFDKKFTAGKSWGNKNNCKVIISRSFFDKYIEKAPYMIETTLFHELGHGLLNRGHRNEVYDSTYYQYNKLHQDTIEFHKYIPHSIMSESNGTVNYKRYREYYIRELFGLEQYLNIQ